MKTLWPGQREGEARLLAAAMTRSVGELGLFGYIYNVRCVWISGTCNCRLVIVNPALNYLLVGILINVSYFYWTIFYQIVYSLIAADMLKSKKKFVGHDSLFHTTLNGKDHFDIMLKS